MEIQKLYVTLALDANDFKAGMATVTGIVAAGAIAASAAVAAVAIDGVKAAKDMEEQMSGIAAIFSTTVDEIQPLGALIKELGLNPNLKVNATEAADAIEMLGKNGLTMAEILDGAAESTVLLANSTGADFATAANIGTDAMALFKIEAGDMIDAVDGITSVTVNSKFGINDYALALAQGGGVASAVGVSFSDFNTTIAAISPLFKSGSDAGTSMKTMLMRLEPQTSKAQDAMAELGLWTEEAGSAFFDSSGNMKEMGEISLMMNRAFGDMSEQQRLSTMQTIFGSDAMRAAVGLMETGVVVTGSIAEVMEKYGVSQEIANAAINDGWTEFDLLKKTMSQTDAMAAAATRMDNLSGAMEIFEGIMDTVKLTLGQALLPIIRIFVDWLIVIADQAMPKIDAAFTVFATVLTSFFNNLGEGMGVMDAFIEAIWDFIPPELAMKLTEIRDGITTVMTAVSAFLTPIWEAITAFVSWKDVLIAVGIAITVTVVPIILGLIVTLAQLMIPILAVIAVIALLRSAWESNFLGIRDTTQTVWTNIQDFITEAWDAIQSIIAAVLAVVGPAIETFTENARTSLGKFDTLLPALGKLWEAIKPIVIFVLEVIGAQIVVFLGVALAMFNGVAAAVGPFIDTFVKMMGDVIQVFTGIANFITGFFELVVALFQGNGEAVEVAWQKMTDGLMDIVEGLVMFIWDSLEGMVKTVWALIEGFVEGFIEFFETLYDELVGNSIIPDLIADIIGLFADAVKDWIAAGASIIDGIIKGIKDGAGKLKDAAIAAARAALDAAKKFLGIASPSKKAQAEIGLQFSTGIALGIVDGIGAIMQAINEVAGMVEVETISKFADAANKVFSMIGAAIDATRQLSQANFPEIVQGWHLREQMVTFRQIVATMMREFELIAGDMDEEHAKTLTAFAKAADAIFDLVEGALAGAVALSEFDFAAVVQKWHLRDQIVIFRRIVATVMREFALAAAEMEEGISKEVNDFAKAANDLFDMVEIGLAGAVALSKINFDEVVQGWHLRDQIVIFRNIVRTMIREFALIGDEFGANEANSIAALSGHINTFVGNLGEIIDNVFIMLEKLSLFVNARMPAGLGGITNRMIQVLRAAVNPARMAGVEIGNAFIEGLVSAIVGGFSQVQDALNNMTMRLEYQPAQPQAGFAGGTVGTGSGRSVVVEPGAFNITINDKMDVEEFKFTMTEIIKSWTE